MRCPFGCDEYTTTPANCAFKWLDAREFLGRDPSKDREEAVVKASHHNTSWSSEVLYRSFDQTELEGFADEAEPILRRDGWLGAPTPLARSMSVFAFVNRMFALRNVTSHNFELT